MITTQSAWKVGKHSLVVTIDSTIRKALDIKQGDILEVDIKVVKRAEKKEKNKEEKGFVLGGFNRK